MGNPPISVYIIDIHLYPSCTTCWQKLKAIQPMGVLLLFQMNPMKQRASIWHPTRSGMQPVQAVLFFLPQDLTIFDPSTNESPACAHCRSTFGHSAQTQPCQGLQFSRPSQHTDPFHVMLMYLCIYVSMYVRVCVCLRVWAVCLFVCLFVCLSVCLFVCLSVCLFVCLSVCLFVCLSVCLSVCLFVCLSVCLSVCLFVCLSVCLFVCLSVCLFFCFSVCLFFCFSVCLFECLSVCLFVWLFVCLFV